MRIRPLRFSIVLLAALTLLASTGYSDVKLPAVLSDHMVLQQQQPVPIWGTADPGEQVTVTFGTQKQTTTADASGKWKVALQPLRASAQPAELTVAGKNSVKLEDILVGEVWVCSGQSNMEFAMRTVKNSEEEIAAANNPMIRLFTVPKWVQEKPQSDIKPNRRQNEGKWEACTPETIPNFTAVGYFFGRDIQKSLRVPVGLIHTSWGGTPAESWTADSYLQNDPEFKPILERRERAPADYRKALAAWEKQAERDKAANKPEPRKPAAPESNPNLASVLYNGMIAPIVPYAIRGSTWYQGESNAGRAYQYRKLLPAMIKSWRDAWGEPTMSFMIVSLANYQNPPKKPGDSEWAELREAQTMTANMPYNGQALAIDLADADDPNNIHPKNKQDVGHRLAYVALAKAYGQSIEYAGPEYESFKIEKDAIRVLFKHAEGMKVRGESVKGFQIAGDDHEWHWADARIDKASVVVFSAEVPKPVAVRYDWANNPQGNLYNRAGLPMVPFRTDKWPGVTEKNK